MTNHPKETKLTRKVPLKIAIADHPHTSAIRNGSIPIGARGK